MRKLFEALRGRILLVSVIIILFCLFILLLNIRTNRLKTVIAIEGDYLVYAISSYSGKSSLIFYDPTKDTHTPILSDWDIRGVSMSAKGRLALSISHEGNIAIYILDYPFINGVPVNITNDISTQYGYRMAWSPDGRYLAYTPLQTEETNLLVWDGESSFQIAHSPAGIGDIAWGTDSRLAFVIFYTHSFPYEGDSSEAFIWDGEAIVNLSQNPTGTDRFPIWNKDGHVAFLSERKETYDIFIWDGISISDDMPDVNTFNNIAPNLTGYFSIPMWTNSGSLTFEGSGTKDSGFTQIYEWNGTNNINISQNPNSHNGGQRWRSDGYWSFNTYWSGEQLIYIRDETNKTRLTLEGYGARWSESGYFIFCQRTVTGSRWHFQKWEIPELIREYRGWTLSMGNGSKIIEIAQGDRIYAAWSNGEAVACLDG